MKTILQFDFIVDKQNNTINVKREFAAGIDLVWDAWTKPELLDKWWAPKPYKTVTKSMNFTEGGMWLYYMVSPQDEKHWCKNDYLKIDPKKYFSGLDAFCDENGNDNTDMPRTLWNNVFTKRNNDVTLVEITAKYNSLEDLERIISLGFKEGFTMAMGNLDELLSILTK